MKSTSPAPSAAGPLWYKDAVIYELRVRSFFDSDGDGIGDLRGLTEKLGYLQDLGVTAVWLLPFYPSPLRDDGYDISDYTGVHPDYGTLADFEGFLAEAHRRGLHVITELVLNHSSDQHPWFQRARRAPRGSPERELYVWSDTPERFAEARIIFKDYEPSNWSWDPVAKAYYWHRFYAHQPDLNYDNPAVREAMFEVVDFWLGLGVDGLRLDAVPYLFEREGTSCENVPETHAFLRDLRAHIDARYEGRMLLAEANQWPEDAVAYFGQGDECHMAFHFPVMPRIFVAIHLEDRFPLTDILAQTPSLPPGCQWALFLRNHDELTLEMVSDEERDAMYRAYAAEPVMRVNLGIRRRLAPLAQNQRRHIELMNALLFSLPGTPVVYYGDEIGMGDNVYLGDRNGVRTPMQWSADKNAGFSRANPQQLILPVIIDPDYHYESVNVEAQQNSPGSLLWWTKRLVGLRKRHVAFGRGSLELLRPDNPRILAFVRHYHGGWHDGGSAPTAQGCHDGGSAPKPPAQGCHEDEVILVVANLSRFMQFVELDLSPWKGTVPVELFGRTSLPAVGDAPYPLTLAGHGFYWFAMAPPTHDEARAAAYEPKVLEQPWPGALRGDSSQAIAEVLAGWAMAQAWYAGRKRRVEAARIAEVVPVTMGGDPPAKAVPDPLVAHLVVLELTYEEGGAERYLLAPAHATEASSFGDGSKPPYARQAVIASVKAPDGSAGVIFDALADGPSARALLESVFTRGRLPGYRAESGSALRTPNADPERAVVITAQATPALPVGAPASSPSPAGVSPGAVVLFGERFLLDVSRRLDDGASPGLELERLLAEGGIAAPVPAFAGAVELTAPRAEPVALAVVRTFVLSESDGFTHTVSEVHRFFERVLARGPEVPAPRILPFDARALGSMEVPAQVRDSVGAFLDTARLLGRRTAELHRAIAGAPVPCSPLDQRGIYQSMRNLAGRTLRELGHRARALPPEVAPLAASVIARHDEVLRRLGALLGRRLTGPRTRHLGAIDLRRVLLTGNDLVFADLEGDRARPVAERRRRGSPLRDVASLIRSLHEAALSALLDPARVRPEDVEAARPWAHAFWEGSSAALVQAYVEVTRESGLLPPAPGELETLLDAFLLDSAFGALAAALDAGQAARQVVSLRLLITLLEERPAG